MINSQELNEAYFTNLKSTDLRNQVNTILDLIDKGFLTKDIAEYFTNILIALKITSNVTKDSNEIVELALELLNSGKDVSKINIDDYKEEFYARPLDVAITKRKSEIEDLMSEYNSIIDSLLDQSIITSFEKEFNKLPETYNLNVDLLLISDKGFGYRNLHNEKCAFIGHINATGSEHTIAFNEKAGTRTFKFKRNTTNSYRFLKTMRSLDEVNRLYKSLKSDINLIKKIETTKLDYIVSLSFSKGNSNSGDSAKLKEICNTVFNGKATNVGKNSNYCGQQWRTGVASELNNPIDPNLTLKVKDKSISVWRGKYLVVDEYIVEKYKQLADIGLSDYEEQGYMTYKGQLNTTELVNKLTSMGFNAVLENIK